MSDLTLGQSFKVKYLNNEILEMIFGVNVVVCNGNSKLIILSKNNFACFGTCCVC